MINKIEQEYGCQINFYYKENKYFLQSISTFNIPCERVYASLEHMCSDISNILKGVESENVIPLFGKPEEIKEDNYLINNIVQFPKLKKPYILKKSDPKKLEQAVLFINNIQKPLGDQDQKYKDFFK